MCRRVDCSSVQALRVKQLCCCAVVRKNATTRSMKPRRRSMRATARFRKPASMRKLVPLIVLLCAATATSTYNVEAFLANACSSTDAGSRVADASIASRRGPTDKADLVMQLSADQCPFYPSEHAIQRAKLRKQCFNNGHIADAYHFLHQRPSLRAREVRAFDASIEVAQETSELGFDRDVARKRALAIREAANATWHAYADVAFGADELRPLSRTGVDNFGGLGIMILDSLSALWIFDLEPEYARAVEWTRTALSFDRSDKDAIVFEVVIRALAGLVSAFELSADAALLRSAEDLAMRLSFAYLTESGIPHQKCVLSTRRCSSQANALPLAEVGTVQLEYRALSALCNDSFVRGLRYSAEDFYRLVEQHLDASEMLALEECATSSQSVDSIASAAQSADEPLSCIEELHRNAVLPARVRVSDGSFLTGGLITLGSPSDSYFEYLLKIWAQGGYREQRFFEMFRDVVEHVEREFVGMSSTGDLLLLEMAGEARVHYKMDHFSCFFPAVLMLAAQCAFSPLSSGERSRWTKLAEELTETCHQFYARSPSGLSGEHVRYDRGKWMQFGGYELRPEAIEAFFVMWRLTRQAKYREYAWSIFEQMEKHAKVVSSDGAHRGYAVIKDAKASRRPKKTDVMHTFVLSETLQYLYLIFCDDTFLSLQEWVFNTEAHPLRIRLLLRI